MPDCCCGYVVRWTPGFDFVTGGPSALRDGDFHVCPACGTVLVYLASRWRPATVDELFTADPQARQMLARISIAIERAQRDQVGHGAGGMIN